MSGAAGKKGSLGKRGEDIAAEYLAERHYEILQRNFRYRRREIDIVARKNGVLVFVEVKTRASVAFGEPEEAVDVRKRQILKRVAAAYLSRYGRNDCPCRFDIVGVLIRNGGWSVRHTEDIFS